MNKRNPNEQHTFRGLRIEDKRSHSLYFECDEFETFSRILSISSVNLTSFEPVALAVNSFIQVFRERLGWIFLILKPVRIETDQVLRYIYCGSLRVHPSIRIVHFRFLHLSKYQRHQALMANVCERLCPVLFVHLDGAVVYIIHSSLYIVKFLKMIKDFNIQFVVFQKTGESLRCFAFTMRRYAFVPVDQTWMIFLVCLGPLDFYPFGNRNDRTLRKSQNLVRWKRFEDETEETSTVLDARNTRVLWSCLLFSLCFFWACLEFDL